MTSIRLFVLVRVATILIALSSATSCGSKTSSACSGSDCTCPDGTPSCVEEGVCQCTGGSGGSGGTTNPGTCSPSILFLDAVVKDAEYLRVQDVAALVTDAPSELLLIDPTTGTVASADIPNTPVAVSVSPTGQTIAASWGNSVEAFSASGLSPMGGGQVTFDVHDMVVGDNGYAYVWTPEDSGSFGRAYSVELASGTVTEWDETPTGGPDDRTRVKMHPSGTRIYALDDAEHATSGAVWGTTAGLLDKAWSIEVDEITCSNLWMSAPGDLMYTACGNVFSLGSSLSTDMIYYGSMADFVGYIGENIGHAYHIPSAGLVAWVGELGHLPFQPPEIDEEALYGHEIHLHDDVTLEEVDVVDLPCTVEVDDDDMTYITRHVFANNAGTELYVVRVSETVGRSAIVTVPIP